MPNPLHDLALFLLAFASLVAPHLGSDHFPTREQATTALRELDLFALPALMLARHDEDAEVRARAAWLLAEWRASYRPTSYPVLPWIDSLPPDVLDRDETIRRMLERVGPDYSAASTGWVRYRLATELLVDEWIAEGRTRTEIVATLDTMAEQDKRWIKGASYVHLKPLLDDKLPEPMGE